MKHTLFSLSLLIAFGAGAQSSIEAVGKASKIIDEVRAVHAPDKRQVVFDIKAYNDPDGGMIVGGKTSEASARDALVAQLNASGADYSDRIAVLPDTLWAQPRISVACLRTRPGHASEMASQAIMGMPLRVLEKEGDWYRVQTPVSYTHLTLPTT